MSAEEGVVGTCSKTRLSVKGDSVANCRSELTSLSARLPSYAQLRSFLLTHDMMHNAADTQDIRRRELRRERNRRYQDALKKKKECVSSKCSSQHKTSC